MTICIFLMAAICIPFVLLRPRPRRVGPLCFDGRCLSVCPVPDFVGAATKLLAFQGITGGGAYCTVDSLAEQLVFLLPYM